MFFSQEDCELCEGRSAVAALFRVRRAQGYGAARSERGKRELRNEGEGASDFLINWALR
jgi:hypothetical protein